MDPADLVVVTPISHRRRALKALLAFALTTCAVSFLVWEGITTNHLADDWGYSVAIAVVGLIATASLYRQKTLVQPTAEAVQLRAQAVEQDRIATEERERRWYFRYPFAALLLGGAFAIWDQKPGAWWLAAGMVVVAAFQAFELTLLCIGLLALYLLFLGIVALPVSAAIVLGALIIAAAVRASKK